MKKGELSFAFRMFGADRDRTLRETAIGSLRKALPLRRTAY